MAPAAGRIAASRHARHAQLSRPGDVPCRRPDRASVLGEFGGPRPAHRGHPLATKNNWGYRTLSTAMSFRRLPPLNERLCSLARRGLAAASTRRRPTSRARSRPGHLRPQADQDRRATDGRREPARHRRRDRARARHRVGGDVGEPAADVSLHVRSTAGRWEQPGFDDAAWASGQGPFGGGRTRVPINTEWSTPEHVAASRGEARRAAGRCSVRSTRP
jgi:hypothetical protein